MVPAAHQCPLFSLCLWSEGGLHFVPFLSLPCSASLQYHSLSGRLVSRMGSVPPRGWLCPHAPTVTFPPPGSAAPAPGPEPFGSWGDPSRVVPRCVVSPGSLGGRRREDALQLGLAAFPQCRLSPAQGCVTLMKGRLTGALLPYTPHQAYLCTANKTLFGNPGL